MKSTAARQKGESGTEHDSSIKQKGIWSKSDTKNKQKNLAIFQFKVAVSIRYRTTLNHPNGNPS